MAYGVDTADITAEVAGLVLGTSTTPTAAMVTEWITASEDRINAFLAPLGVDTTALMAATTSKAYGLIRRWVTLETASRALRSRDRNVGELYRALRDEASEIWNQIEKRPATLGDYQPVATTSPNLVTTNRTISGVTTVTVGSSYLDGGNGRL